MLSSFLRFTYAFLKPEGRSTDTKNFASSSKEILAEWDLASQRT